MSRWPVALAMPKSMILGHRDAVLKRHQHVGRLEVAVDDPLLVGVLHRPADQHEQLQPLRDRQADSGRSSP